MGSIYAAGHRLTWPRKKPVKTGEKSEGIDAEGLESVKNR
jgi:hypothetical protein